MADPVNPHRIYLDYNASTPVHPAVQAALVPLLGEHYGNPSSGHWAGSPAARAVAHARAQIADLLGCWLAEYSSRAMAQSINTELLGASFTSGAAE